MFSDHPHQHASTLKDCAVRREGSHGFTDNPMFVGINDDLALAGLRHLASDNAAGYLYFGPRQRPDAFRETLS